MMYWCPLEAKEAPNDIETHYMEQLLGGRGIMIELRVRPSMDLKNKG